MQHRSLSQALQHIATAQRLKTLLLLSIAVPLLVFAALAWHGHRRVERYALDRLDQITRTVQEHAIKALETTELILDRVTDLVGDARDGLSHDDEERLHAMLTPITERYVQVRNIALWGADGRPVVSARHYPVPRNVSIADRPHFARHKTGGVTISFNEPLDGRLGNARVFNITKARIRPDGAFAGVMSLSLSPAYFADFYRRVAGGDDGLTITLLREEGEVVSSHPDSRGTLRAATRSVLAAARDGMGNAVVHGIKNPDGELHYAVLRKVGSQPLYVAVSRTNSSVFTEWRHDMLTAAMCLIPGSLTLTLVIWLAWKRTENEHLALIKAHDEEGKRSRAEEQLRQLQKFEALGQLTSGLAHDFNNLLHIVSANCVIMRMMTAQTGKAGPIDAIDRAVASGQSLVRHLLAFAHKRSFALESVSPASVLPDMCELARHSLPKTIAMRCAVEPDAWDIAVDRSELELAIINMAVNARDAMPGGGTITVCARNVSADSAERMNAPLSACDFVAISVSDTGTGIPEALLERVFEPFFTTKQGRNGTGLGLSRVYMYAAQSGGGAVAANAPTGGAVITLYIPRAARPGPQSAPSSLNSFVCDVE